jgi:hypothetical protein
LLQDDKSNCTTTIRLGLTLDGFLLACTRYRTKSQ